MTEKSENNTINVEHGLLPDFCDVRVLFILVLLTELLALVLSLAVPGSLYHFWDYLAFVSMLMQWIALVNAALLCPLRRLLNKMADGIAITLIFSIMLLVSLLISWLSIKLNTHLFYVIDSGKVKQLDQTFLLRIMAISAAVYAVVLRYFYIQRQWQRNIAAQAKAEIQALRARIRPHFLFNSMNTIASLIAISPQIAETAIEDLSDLFRASLSERNMNTVEDELQLTRSYLNIEKLRLGKRLQVAWEVDNTLKNMPIPALCIQPLVENAIYHGIEPLPEGGKILLSTLKHGGYLVISVRNPLGRLTSRQYHKGNQMAQSNIKQRLFLVYGKTAVFKINDTKETYTVTLKIPLAETEK